MKYQCKIEINASPRKVAALFTDPNLYHEWQDGFICLNHKGGQEGQKGAISELVFKTNNKRRIIVETILENKLPHSFHASYKSTSAYNEMRFSFVASDDNTTIACIDNYYKFKGLFKIVAIVMPRAFKRQSNKLLANFKAFVEKECNLDITSSTVTVINESTKQQRQSQ